MAYQGQEISGSLEDVAYKKCPDYEFTNDQNSDEDGDECSQNEYPIGDGQFIERSRFRNNGLPNRSRHGLPHRAEAIKVANSKDKFGHLGYGSHMPYANRQYSSAFYPNVCRSSLPHSHGDIGDCNSFVRSSIPRFYRKKGTDPMQLYQQECLFRQVSRPKEPLTYDMMKCSFDENYEMNRRRKHLSSFPSFLNPDETKTSRIAPTESRSSFFRGEKSTTQKFTESSKTTRKTNQNTESHNSNVGETAKSDANFTYEHLSDGNNDIGLRKTSTPIKDSNAEPDYRNSEYTQKEPSRVSEYHGKEVPESVTDPSLDSESSTTEMRNQVVSENKLCLKDETNPSKITESARSGKSRISTITKKQFNDLANLERSKSNALSVIDDGLLRIETRNENTKSEKSSHTYTCDPPIFDPENKKLAQGLEIVRSEFMDNMFKECRGYHLENMKQEIKRMQYLDSLPEKWAKHKFSSNL